MSASKIWKFENRKPWVTCSLWFLLDNPSLSCPENKDTFATEYSFEHAVDEKLTVHTCSFEQFKINSVKRQPSI